MWLVRLTREQTHSASTVPTWHCTSRCVYNKIAPNELAPNSLHSSSQPESVTLLLSSLSTSDSASLDGDLPGYANCTRRGSHVGEHGDLVPGPMDATVKISIDSAKIHAKSRRTSVKSHIGRSRHILLHPYGTSFTSTFESSAIRSCRSRADAFAGNAQTSSHIIFRAAAVTVSGGASGQSQYAGISVRLRASF